MYLKVILSIFLILLSGSIAEDRQFYQCKFDDSKVLQFSCEQPSSLFYSEKCNVVNETRQSFKCDGAHVSKAFTFRQNDFFDVEELYIESLGIKHIHVEGDGFRSESTGMLEGFLGFGLIKTVTIKTLSASGNELNSIPTSISMPSLASLDLSNNRFTRITSDELMGAFQVSRLSFAHNQIRTLDTEVFKNLTELQYLDLSHNHLRSKNLEHFKNPANLQHLDLSHNSLEEINEETFVGDANLRHLNLSNNQINEIEFGAFSTLKHLQTLDLSNNALKSFDLGAMEELTHLNLEGNLLTLEYVTPEKYPNLQVVTISRNIFNCDNLNDFLKQWHGDAKLYKDGKQIEPSFTNCHDGIVKIIIAGSSAENDINADHHEKTQLHIDQPNHDLIEEENDVQVNLDDVQEDQEYHEQSNKDERAALNVHNSNRDYLQSIENQKGFEASVPAVEITKSYSSSSAKLQTKENQNGNTVLSSSNVALICVLVAIAGLIVGAVFVVRMRKRQTNAPPADAYDAVAMEAINTPTEA